MEKRYLLLKNGKIKKFEKVIEYERECFFISEEEKNNLSEISDDERKLFYELNIDREDDLTFLTYKEKYDLGIYLYAGLI